MKKRLLITALLAAMLCTACGSPAGQQTDTTAPTPDQVITSPAETTAVPETTIPAPQIDAIDGGGEEFHILGRLSGSDQYYLPYPEFKATEVTGEVMNDAVFDRNRYLEQKYKVTIVGDEDKEANVPNIARTNINANDAHYDLYMPTTQNAYPLAIEGLFYETDAVPYLDFEKPWWQAQAMEALTIANSNFLLISDISFSNFLATSTIFFNQKVAADNEIPNFYQTVREGKWTIDLMHEYCLKITRDLDGDQDIDENDIWGTACSNFSWQPLFYGSGSRIIEKDADDIPQLVWLSEKNMNVIDKITKFLNDENATMLSQQHPEWKTGNPTYFTEDRALFRIEQIYGIKQIREMESDFGMLPAPKYDEAQEQYSSYVHPGQSNSICIPVTNTRLELTGALLEDGSYKSFEKIRPAFYDVTLKGRIARDEDTTEMLDIIFATLNPDLALALTKSAGITIDTDMRKIYTNDMDAYTSMLTVSAKLNERLLKLCVDKILALGN